VDEHHAGAAACVREIGLGRAESPELVGDGPGEPEAVGGAKAAMGGGREHLELAPGTAGGTPLQHELLTPGRQRGAGEGTGEGDRAPYVRGKRRDREREMGGDRERERSDYVGG
jgi:hypothetical protein